MTSQQEMGKLQRQFSIWIRDEPRVIRDFTRVARIISIFSIVVALGAIVCVAW